MCGHGVGVCGVLQPEVIGEVRVQLGCLESHLRRELARTLLTVSKLGGLRPIEDHYGLRIHRAVLGGTEGEDVDPGPPGHIGGGRPDADQRVGEPSTVHVHGEPCAPRYPAQFAELSERIDAAHLGRLRDADHRGLHRLHLATPTVHGSGKGIRVQLAVVSGKGDQLGSVAEELRSPGLIVVDVTVPVAQHCPPRRGEGRQGEAVRGRPRAHDEHIKLAFEDISKPPGHPFGDVICTIWHSSTVCLLGHGRDDPG